MSREQKRNLPASVRSRLLQVSKDRHLPFDLILSRYAIERLLYRLSQSPHAPQFLLKGAMLFAVWTEATFRPTRDVDFLCFGPSDTASIERIFRELCSLEVEPDGLIFLPDTVQVRPIREDQHYGGVRVELEALLDRAKIDIQADIGFGDSVTPGPEEIEFPTLLPNFPAPRLRAYPTYTVVAEKLEAMASLGQGNSRMKDFYDVWFLASRFDFEGSSLAEAIRRTFERRQTPLDFPDNILASTFADAKTAEWRAFVSRNALACPPFDALLALVRGFVEPPFRGAAEGKAFAARWRSAATAWE